MTSAAGSGPDEPLSEVAFLVRSPNRVRLLTLLESNPTALRDLERAMGVSRVTLNRIVNDFEARSWLVRSPEGVAITRAGERIHAALEALLETVEREHRLRDVVRWLPIEEMDVDASRFADATVSRPTRLEPTVPFRELATFLVDGSDATLVADVITPIDYALDALRARSSDRGSIGPVEIQVTEPIFEAIRSNSRRRDRLRTVIDDRRIAVYHADGPIPCCFAIADGDVALVPTDERGLPLAFVESDDATIRSWAAEFVESRREERSTVAASQLRATTS